ncbi:MAG: DnaB helicase C-terminal domain-containing protein, partial [Anaerolineae bacterium]|nr:DnaB helicase C-terminal domain-containing protein [Anaerolineae bacterium]
MPEPKSKADLPVGSQPPRDLEEASILLAAELKTGDPLVFEPVKTGFYKIDQALGGGLQVEDFVILGGPQNVGKTALMLQWAISAARQDALAIVVCYEHSVVLLLQRLLCLISEEIASIKGAEYRITFVKLRVAFREAMLEKGKAAHITDVVDRLKGGREAWQLLTELWRNIWLVHGNGNHTDVEAIEGYLKMAKAYLGDR